MKRSPEHIIMMPPDPVVMPPDPVVMPPPVPSCEALNLPILVVRDNQVTTAAAYGDFYVEVNPPISSRNHDWAQPR